jgi:uncharacterized membrane protein
MSRATAIRDYLLGTLWFVPSLIVLASIALAVGMVELSSRVDDEALANWPRVFGASADSSRSILGAIASGMITVAGLTFSLTMIAVTQASSQYTPRILRTFMSDRPNQFVLGTFVGIFAYCLVVLRTVRSVEEERFVPSLAVVLAILLAMVGIGILIYFVHHIATTLQVSSVLARVSDDTTRAMDTLFPDTLGNEASEDQERAAESAAAVSTWHPVPSPATGYVQYVDEDGLLDAAATSRRLVRMDRGIGEFVIEGQPLASVAETLAPGTPVPLRTPDVDKARKALDGHIANAYRIGPHRTVEQDASYGLRQIVDVALKALSPSVNETTTAVSCVDYLGALLVRLTGRRVESPVRERDGVVCVLARGPDFAQMLRLACDEIRQSATGNVTVLSRLMSMLAEVGRCSSNPDRRTLVAEQIGLVHEVAERTVQSPMERQSLLEDYVQAARAVVPMSLGTSPVGVHATVPLHGGRERA